MQNIRNYNSRCDMHIVSVAATEEKNKQSKFVTV